MKVLLSKRSAKWVLDNPDCWVAPGGKIDKDWKIITQMSMACILGVPIIGEKGRQGADSLTFRVDFDTTFGKYWSYYEFFKNGRMN